MKKSHKIIISILISLLVIIIILAVYPQNLENKWTPKKCRLFIRILAVIEIILAFATRTNFYKEDYTTVYSTAIVTTNTNPTQIAFQVGSIVLIVAIVIGVVVWIRKRK